MLESAPVLFKVTPENQKAVLTFGAHRFDIQIRSVSRSSFVASVQQNLAKKLGVGKLGKLYFQDTVYRVSFVNKWLEGQGLCEVEMSLIEELQKPKLEKKSFWARSKTVDLNPKDPVLPTTMLTAFVITVLILPAWGGKWGTSDVLCSGVTNIWTAMTDLMTGRR